MMDDDDGQSSSSDSVDKCLGFLLGGINIAEISGDAWENESQHEAENNDGFVVSTKQSSDGLGSIPNSIEVQHGKSFTDLPENVTKDIVASAYKCTEEGKILSPPVRIVDMNNKGNGLVANSTIRNGEVIFTERAAEAVQLFSSRRASEDGKNEISSNEIKLRACQHCFRSLEPVSSCLPSTEDRIPLPLAHLWPVQDYDGIFDKKLDGRFLADNHGRVVCASCNIMFCSPSCQNSFVAISGTCCNHSKVMETVKLCSTQAAKQCCKGSEVFNNLGTIEAQPAVLLATRIFYRLAHHCRRSGNLDLGPFRGLCGNSSDVDPLELGVVNQCADDETPMHTVEPHYNAICKVLGLDPREKQCLSLEFYSQLCSIAARNGVEMATQSPFNVYYASLVRAGGGRGSDRHAQFVKQVARALGSKNGHLARDMDEAVSEKVGARIAAIFPLTARINHSCKPCAEIRSQMFVDAHVDVVATRRIEKGEEITISYINLGRKEGRKDRHQRQKVLQARYLFQCQCPACIE